VWRTSKGSTPVLFLKYFLNNIYFFNFIKKSGMLELLFDMLYLVICTVVYSYRSFHQFGHLGTFGQLVWDTCVTSC
jgi:hypothetical protein